MNYDRVFQQKHHVKATLGFMRSQNRGKNLTSHAYNIPYNSNDFADISLADGKNLQNNTSSWQYVNRLQSYFVRGEYVYDQKYLFSGIIRRDGSTRFGTNNRFEYFPSVSVGWVASAEPFFNVNFIQFLKLKLSYGQAGNERIKDFAYLELLNGEGVYPFNDQLVSGRAAGIRRNPNIRWENNSQTNIGIEATILKDKLDITLDYFSKKTSGLLFQPDVSALTGAYGAGTQPPYVNGGSVKNTGIEVSLDYSDNINKDLTYTIGLNMTSIKNEVTELPTGVDFLDAGSFGVGERKITRMQVGQPIGAFFGYQTDGIYQTQEEIDNRGVSQAVGEDKPHPGDFRYVDQDGDGVVNFSNFSDKRFLGSSVPKAIIGLNLNLNYKGIDFSALLYTSLGNRMVRNYERNQPLANMNAVWINRWTGAGSTNEYPRLTTGANRNTVFSDFYVEDASYTRLKNIQLGYTISNRLLKKYGIQSLRFYFSINNLFTITKYQGYDPDYISTDPVIGGVDIGAYPQAKTFMTGFNLKF